MKTYVLYHSGCNDGFCAAWVAHKRLGEQNIEYIPVRYGEAPPPMEDGSEVCILDFSYKAEVLLELARRMEHVTVLDHHKTAEEDLRDLNIPSCDIRFNMSKSGARLTWDYWFGGATPMLVQYTEDRDLWRWQLPHSREVNAYISSFPHDFSVWDKLEFDLTTNFGMTVDSGASIIRYQNQQIERICKNAVEIELAGHKILAVNTCCMQSEVAGKLAEGRPFGAAWHVRSDNKRQWSLRSRDGGVDVAEIARASGGGGHRNAAGYEEANVS